MTKTILVTGGAGLVATLLRPFLRSDYRVRLTDLRPVTGLEDGEEYVAADLGDLDAVCEAASGADAIVHLGGVAKEEGWDTILPANIMGAYNVFEAARRTGVKRMIYASSSHAVGFYRRDQRISVTDPVRPDGRYGLSKVFGEGLARLYFDKYGIPALCIRIGAVSETPQDVRRMSTWLTPRDLAQLVRLGLERPQLEFEIVFGISDNARSWWDNSNALRLGYRPRDRSEDYAEEVLRNEPEWAVPDDLAQIVQGGPYATLEFIEDPGKPAGQ